VERGKTKTNDREVLYIIMKHRKESSVGTDIFDITLGPGEGHAIDLGAIQLTWKATSGDTGGAYALAEYVGAPGSGSAFHTHSRENETFYIVEGAMTFQLGEREFRAEAGAYVWVPRGLRHAFVNAEAEPVRALMLVAPAGLERFFEELAALSRRPDGPPADEVAALAQRYGLDFS
jgi:quercetin dioxygenase-like cupin family protein